MLKIGWTVVKIQLSRIFWENIHAFRFKKKSITHSKHCNQKLSSYTLEVQFLCPRELQFLKNQQNFSENLYFLLCFKNTTNFHQNSLLNFERAAPDPITINFSSNPPESLFQGSSLLSPKKSGSLFERFWEWGSVHHVFGAEKRELGPLQQEVCQTLEKDKSFKLFLKMEKSRNWHWRHCLISYDEWRDRKRYQSTHLATSVQFSTVIFSRRFKLQKWAASGEHIFLKPCFFNLKRVCWTHGPNMGLDKYIDNTPPPPLPYVIRTLEITVLDASLSREKNLMPAPSETKKITYFR